MKGRSNEKIIRATYLERLKKYKDQKIIKIIS
jgi:hypothetical protein